MPLVPIAAFLAGALLTLLLPVALLIALVVWYWLFSVRVPETADASEHRAGAGCGESGAERPRGPPARARGVMKAGAGTLWASRPAMLRPARIAGALLVAVILGLGVGFGVHRLTAGTAAAPATVSTRFGMHGEAAWAEGTQPAPMIDTLRDQTGQLFSLASLRGRSVAIVFFDSHCHQECPLEGRELAAAEQSLPPAQRPVLVAVSVNPLDTPASATSAAKAWGLAAVASWYWLMGTAQATGARVGGVPHLCLAASGGWRHRAHRGGLSGRPARLLAVGLHVSVPVPVRDQRPTYDRRGQGSLRVAVSNFVEALPAPVPVRVGRASQAWRDYVTLTKPRIMSLLVLTAVCAMVAAAGGAPAPVPLAALVIGGALACGGASALNHVLDRDIDRLMGPRTASRPVAAGRISPARATAFGLVLSALAFAVLAAFANPLAAALSLSGGAFYVVVYTCWLKRSTAQNIVIGGAAGAIPPLAGWAAAHGSLGLGAGFLFLIVLLWTPPHFWALALLLSRHYAAAGVPMMPVVRGPRATARLVFWYSVVLLAVTLVPGAIGTFGLVYLVGPRSWEECCARSPGGSGATARLRAPPCSSTSRCSTSRCCSSPSRSMRRCAESGGNRADGRTGRASQRGPPRVGLALHRSRTARWLSAGALPAVTWPDSQ